MMSESADAAEIALGRLREIHPVSRETIDAFTCFGGLLETWQRKTNLVAPDTLSHFWSRHVADSLQCLSLFPDACRWLDIGSGAGFPGMVISIANRGHGERQHHLVESNRKKCAFLRAVALETRAQAAIHCERIESATERLVQAGIDFDVVTARALAPLAKLIGLAYPVMASGAVGLFHKGRDFQREIQDCDGLWRFDLIIHESRVEADSVLLEIRNPVRQTA